LRQVGNRIGQELAFSLQSLEGHVEFLNEMMDWWEYAGLGELSYNFDPLFYVEANLVSTHNNDDEELPLWEMDYGIIEGALMSRYPEGGDVIIRRNGGESSEESCRFELVFQGGEYVEMSGDVC
jgi:hypothetical protein